MESNDLPPTDQLAPAASPSGLIEIGVVVAGAMDSVDSRASRQAIEQLSEELTQRFPEFVFRIAQLRRPELSDEGRVQPSVLLQQAVEDRDTSRWDFAFVFTSSELVGNYSPFCFAALSRPLDAAVFSLSLIDPIAVGEDADDTERIQRIAKRLNRLMLHALGHLTGLPASEVSHDLLFHPSQASDLDMMESMDQASLARQRTAFAEIADQRLEEGAERPSNRLAFALRAAWINRREVSEAIIGARPWEFPRRLSRLTIASVSTVAILLMTAEAWDLGLAQDGGSLAIMLACCLALTTLYVIVRQQLLLRRSRGQSEQSVVTSASALGIVFVGMAVTWAGLFTMGVAVGWLLFRPELIASWASSSELTTAEVGISTIVRMNLFCASIGLLIGALGASFESQHYFRHVIFVDEEI